MKSILNLIIKPEYTIIGGNIDLRELCLNPNPKIAKLIIKNPDYTLISGNSNPGLTELIIKSANKTDSYSLSSNTNPMLADLIISLDDWLKHWYEIGRNPNTGLTDFILSSPDVECYYISHNTNPKLASLIMEKPNWHNISGNSNIGLTDFILSNPHEVNYDSLSSNTNPLLAKLIIKNRHELNWYKIFMNSNSGLTNFIMENYNDCHKDSFGHSYKASLGQNINPDLTDFILSKLKPNEISASNTNKKLIKYRLSAPDGNIGLSANPSAVVIKKIELL